MEHPPWNNWNLSARLTKSMSVETDEFSILAGNTKGQIFIMLPSFMRFLATICMMAIADHAAITSSCETLRLQPKMVLKAKAAETPLVSGKRSRGKTGSYKSLRRSMPFMRSHSMHWHLCVCMSVCVHIMSLCMCIPVCKYTYVYLLVMIYIHTVIHRRSCHSMYVSRSRSRERSEGVYFSNASYIVAVVMNWSLYPRASTENKPPRIERIERIEITSKYFGPTE